MGIGVAIGTGLFLASGLAINVAGPAVIVSYAIAAAIGLLLGAALTEMAVAHPTAGSFGVYAEMYVSPFAGYAVRVSYWLMQLVATGGHMVAISIYMHYWFPGIPGAVWVLAFAAAIIYVNARAVGTLGSFEYWFAMIKVIAIVVFVVLGFGLLFGFTGEAPIGARHYAGEGGFFPMGPAGVWFGACFAFYSFIGVETVGVTSGEAADPQRTIPRAMRRMVFGLCALYMLTVILLVGLMPWRQAGVGESPFVSVLRRVGFPGAAHLMNFVVLSAAASSANANLYTITRALFSLARAGLVPVGLGAVNARGVPVRALLVSSVGLGVAALVRARWPGSAYQIFFAVALVGGLFVWLMIFVTHLLFRRRVEHLPVRVPFARASSFAGIAAMIAVFVSTWWMPDLRMTVYAAGPWMLALLAGYWVSRRSAGDRAAAAAVSSSR